jgi:hypothetical protein
MVARSFTPRSRKAAKILFVLRAIMNAKPGREKRCAKRARREFRRIHPKGSTSWMTA